MTYLQPTQWFAPSEERAQQIAPSILSWLNDAGSLTQRLKSHCPEEFSVDVLSQAWCLPDESESKLLGIPDTQQVLLREVHLRCSDRLCVYARSVIPSMTLQGEHQGLQHLGNRPLGEYLFSIPTLQRSAIQWSRLSQDAALAKGLVVSQADSEKPIWGRRSLFLIDAKPLLVSEFFLPVLFE